MVPLHQTPHPTTVAAVAGTLPPRLPPLALEHTGLTHQCLPRRSDVSTLPVHATAATLREQRTVHADSLASYHGVRVDQLASQVELNAMQANQVNSCKSGFSLLVCLSWCMKLNIMLQRTIRH